VTPREHIDALDAAIVGLLAERAAVVAALWEQKRARGEPLRDAAREAAIFARVRALGAAQGLDPDAVEAVFVRVVAMAR
jgi:isochorismate pyruvate lyase